MKAQFEMLAKYNAWVNERLYEAAAKIGDADYRADRGAFFGSLHGTLNHLLLGDRIWMHRFTGQGPSPERLDAIQHEQLADLRRAREAEDKRIVDYVDVLTDAQLAGTIRFEDPVKETAAAALAELRGNGLRVVMLTGDNKRTAAAVAEVLGLSEVEAELLPEDKARMVQKLRGEGRVVAIVAALVVFVGSMVAVLVWPERARLAGVLASNAAAIGGSKAGATARSISRVSVAPHTETRRILALTTISRAMPGSAEAWT